MTTPDDIADKLVRLHQEVSTWAVAAVSAIENGQDSRRARSMLAAAQREFAGCLTTHLPIILAALRAVPAPVPEAPAEPHPLSLPGNHSGAIGLKAGDRFIYTDGRRGRLDECLQDGDAFVTWDDGTCDTVKWNHLRPEPRT